MFKKHIVFQNDQANKMCTEATKYLNKNENSITFNKFYKTLLLQNLFFLFTLLCYLVNNPIYTY